MNIYGRNVSPLTVEDTPDLAVDDSTRVPTRYVKFNKAAVRKIFRIPYVATTYHPIPSIRVNVRPKTLKLGIRVVELTMITFLLPLQPRR